MCFDIFNSLIAVKNDDNTKWGVFCRRNDVPQSVLVGEYISFRAMCTAWVDSGNAIAFARGKDSVQHYGVCVGKEQATGDLYVVHRDVTLIDDSLCQALNHEEFDCLFCRRRLETRLRGLNKVNAFQGKVKCEKLSQISHEDSLTQLIIYKCEPGVPMKQCCALSAHKALTRQGETGYNVALRNCEDFAADCCQGYNGQLSSQVEIRALKAALLVTIVLLFLIFWILIGFATSKALAMSLSFYFATRNGGLRLLSYAMLRYWRWQISKHLDQSVHGKTMVFSIQEDQSKSSSCSCFLNKTNINLDVLTTKLDDTRNDWYFVGQYNFYNWLKSDTQRGFRALFDVTTAAYLELKAVWLDATVDQFIEKTVGAEAATIDEIWKHLAHVLIDLKVVTLAYDERIESLENLLAIKIFTISITLMYSCGRLLTEDFLKCLEREDMKAFLQQICGLFNDVAQLNLKCNIESSLPELLRDYAKFRMRLMTPIEQIPKQELAKLFVNTHDQFVALKAWLVCVEASEENNVKQSIVQMYQSHFANIFRYICEAPIRYRLIYDKSVGPLIDYYFSSES